MTDRHERNYSDENATNKDDRNAQRPLSGAGFFEIRVLGHLDDEWSDWFEGLDIKLLENGEMVLSGVIVDQSALMGILNKLHRLNLPLLSVSQGSKKNRCQGRRKNG